MPEQKEQPKEQGLKEKAVDAVSMLLDFGKDDKAAVAEFIQKLKTSLPEMERSTEAQSAFQKQFIDQWKQAFLAAGYDLARELKLPNFNQEQTDKLNKRLDAVLVALRETYDQAHLNRSSLGKKLEELEKQIGEALKEQDVLTLTLNNSAKTPVHIRPLSEFNPLVKPGQKIDPRSLGLAQVVFEEPRLNLASTLRSDNPDTVDIHEGIDAIAKYLITDYFPKHPKMLEQFHIKDIKHMTPKQAVLLASSITMERLTYSQNQINIQTTADKNVQEINDNIAIDQLFKWDKDKKGNGVCRNYSAVMYGVFEAVKSMQQQDKSLLHNTYVLSLGYEGNGTPGFVDMHAWNGVFSLTDEGLHGMVIDTTWAGSAEGNDPAQGGISSKSLDYTNERFFTLVHRLERTDVLPPQLFFKQLHETYRGMPKQKLVELTRDNLQQQIRAISPRMQIGERMIQLLSNTPGLAREVEADLPKFFQSYADDLTAYLESIRKAPDFTGRKAVDNLLLQPFLAKLGSVYGAIDKYVPEAKQGNYRDIFTPVLEKYQLFFSGANYSPQYIDTTYQFLTVAEKARNEKMADRIMRDEFTPQLESKTGLSDWTRKKIPELYRDLPSERQEAYRKTLTGKLQFEELPKDKKMEKEWEQRIARDCGLYLTEGYHLNLGQKTVLLQKFVDAYKQGSFHFIDGSVSIEKPKEANGYSPNRIKIHEDMSQEEILEKLRSIDTFKNKWNAIRGRCSADLRLGSYSGIDLPKDKLETFLSNAESYFTDANRQHLFRYRQIEISSYDDAKDYLRVTLKKDRFVEKTDPADTDKLLKVNDFEKQQKERTQMETRKKFQSLESDSVLDGISLRAEDALKLYDPLKAYLEKLPADKRDALKKHPFTLVVTSEVGGDIYSEDGRALLKKGMPFYLIKSLSYKGSDRLLKENLISADGTVLADKISVAEILSGNRYIQHIEREGKKLPIGYEGNRLSIQISEGRFEDSLQKGDRLIIPQSPTVQLSYTGYEIKAFTHSTSQQLTEGLDRALESHLAVAAEQDKTKKIGINIRPGFYGVDEIKEPQLGRLREFADALVKAKPDVSAVEKIYLVVSDGTFEGEMQSKQFPFRYCLSRETDLKALDELLKNIGMIEASAANVAARKVTFVENTFPTLSGMKSLEEVVKSGDYAGYRVEFTAGIKPEGKDVKVLQDGRVIAETSKGVLKVYEK